MKFFGKYDVVPALPEVANAPAWLNEKIKSKLGGYTFYDYADKAPKDLDSARKLITVYADRAEKVLCELGQGYCLVKLYKGKTDASVKAEMDALIGNWDEKYRHLYPDDRVRKPVKIFAPASLVIGSEQKGFGYLPAWFVSKKLIEKVGPRDKRQAPAEIVWPDVYKQQLIDSMFAQLPTQEQLDADRAQRAA